MSKICLYCKYFDFILYDFDFILYDFGFGHPLQAGCKCHLGLWDAKNDRYDSVKEKRLREIFNQAKTCEKYEEINE